MRASPAPTRLRRGRIRDHFDGRDPKNRADRQRQAVRGRGRGSPHPRGLPAPPAWPHRHPSRLRARGLRRLHHPARRALGALMPDARGAGGWSRPSHRRGHRTVGRRAASAAAGVPRASRPAVRLLHARHADDADRVPARQSESDRAGGADRHFRQSLPLYRLPEHRHRHARRSEAAAGSTAVVRFSCHPVDQLTRPCRNSEPDAVAHVMAIRFDDIGNRLKAFRLGSGLSADEIAGRLGISRTALYRFEKGELAKIETLEKLAELLSVSVPTLLGVGVEYIASAVSYFERMRQIEEASEHIIVLAGPISYLLASDAFDQALGDILRESIPDALAGRKRALAQIEEITVVLRQRKENYRRRQPGIVNLISAIEMEHFLQNGLVGRLGLPDKVRRERRALARAEAEHFVKLMEDEPIGVQIGIVPDTLPHASFQLFRQPDRQVLALSPFRLGEQPNIRVGVAMITSAPEALALHEKMAKELWQRALKGPAAVRLMRVLMEKP